jgi:hypothetical protein
MEGKAPKIIPRSWRAFLKHPLLYPLADAESTELIQKIKTDRTEQVTHSGLAV